MVRRLLLAAALVAAAAAAGEFEMVMADCGCGTGIQTYSTATAAYCPTSTYPSCDITKMVKGNCKISCDGVRSTLAYRNNSAIWLSTSSISCVNGQYQTAEGAKLFNLQRPTCAFKASCDDCSASYETSCPTGMTCKMGNLQSYTDTDGCGRLACSAGTLKLYNDTHQPMAYQANKLFCNTAKKWTNYSLDGTTVGGTQINEVFTANCVLPKACGECVAPTIATELANLPEPFRTGYTIEAPTIYKEAESCSEIYCASGTLFGFSGTATNVTGREYTSREHLQCDGTTHWTNGGQSYIPSNLVVACLKVAPTTTTLPTTTANPCGEYDNVDIGGGSVVCVDGQNQIKCNETGKKIEVFDNEASKLFEKMTFVSGKGWFSFDCSGNGRMWKTGSDEMVAVACEGFI